MGPFDPWGQLDEDPEESGRSLFETVSPDPSPTSAHLHVPTFDWNEDQLRAVDQILSWRCAPSAPRYYKLTGPAGTGKTAVTREIRRRLAGTRTSWAAMTGKATLCLRRALGVSARTFHSALYHSPREVDNVPEARIDLVFDKVKGGFADDLLLVVDEAIMISPRLREDCEHSPYQKVLLIGDPYQIPPVLSRAEESAARGEDYSVFSGIPGPYLRQIMRNGGAVLRAATEVREQQVIPKWSEENAAGSYAFSSFGSPEAAILRAVEDRLDDREDHAVITWRNDVRLRVNAEVRRRLGHLSNTPEPGEPLVVRRNIHRKGLMNGDIVRVEEILEEGPQLAGVPTRWFRVREESSGRVMRLLSPSQDFTGTLPYVGLEVWKRACQAARVDSVCPLTYAYALTCHSAQGSQYRRVTVLVPRDLRNPHFAKSTRLPDGVTMIFAMRWLYTAIARASERASLLFAE